MIISYGRKCSSERSKAVFFINSKFMQDCVHVFYMDSSVVKCLISEGWCEKQNMRALSSPRCYWRGQLLFLRFLWQGLGQLHIYNQDDIKIRWLQNFHSSFLLLTDLWWTSWLWTLAFGFHLRENQWRCLFNPTFPLTLLAPVVGYNWIMLERNVHLSWIYWTMP